MRSTGEVLGMATSPGLAFYKAQQATRAPLPLGGTVLVTVAEADKPGILEAVRELSGLGFRVMATRGTRDFLAGKGIAAELVLKLHEGRPNIVDAIKNREVHLLVNTPAGRDSAHDDSYIRKAAIRAGVPYVTTAAAAAMSAKGIAARTKGAEGVRSLQEFHASIR
jgi:carbamoyl-phosphate synthase large subunit